ncbi:Major facilitator superfamily domain, general substrate transporter [Niveomyces insectorum RCEF 264]|uniref:Major facilitator superfamily domain, general substrate transporter n=1 Tax=Niveomyces insectorum RCEF 264 TaxID=1081102 RepID=A0A167T458_9HYPO|nr:Major facilitator superfamily domain, general substrate transporter [Niveomyces insectorum RCEF 264]
MSEDEMKGTIAHIDGDTAPSVGVSTVGGLEELSNAALEKRIKRKVDWRLIPIMSCMYAISLIDRTNLGGARISGIDQDLGLNLGSRYSVAVLIFYISYAIIELPSNMTLRKVGAANWLSFLCLAFGLITIGIGLIHHYYQLLVLRIFLGCMEAVSNIFQWIPSQKLCADPTFRREHFQDVSISYRLGIENTTCRSALCARRIGMFFSVASFISSFGNVLAYGLTQISSEPERHGWRWIFIIQGVIACTVGIINWFVVADFPDSPRNKFLTPEEKEALTSMLRAEWGTAEGSKVTWPIVVSVCKDWHSFAIAFVYMGGSTATYSFLFFLPIILRNSMGFSQVEAFCLTAPPSAFAVVYSILFSWLSDKFHVRGPFVLFDGVLSVVGLAMTGFAKQPAVRLVGVFFGQAGGVALIGASLSWGQNNVFHDAKRNVTTVLQILFAAVGGVYSALVFRQQDAPAYVPGIVAIGALLLAGCFLSTFTSFWLYRANKKIERGELAIENNPGLRYTW